jgi:hypothetical protein
MSRRDAPRPQPEPPRSPDLDEGLQVHDVPGPSDRLRRARAEIAQMDEAELTVLLVLVRQRLAELAPR